ncbi:hypothetical protein ACFYOI_26650 [Streptomyces microflavus]|uniref:hypothetical protein n=1 Tax=Streptomyces microflavus TaxID=1919 RepID=UPI0033B118D8
MPPVFPDAAIDDPALPELLAEPAAQADDMDADPVNRELSIARKAIGWWHHQGWIECDPTIGMDRRRTGRRGAVASSAMTYDAEDDTSPPMLPARSRHASVCSLERYARPASARPPRMWPNATPLHASARKSGRIRASRSSRDPLNV